MIRFTVYGKAEPAGSKTTGVSKAGRRFVRDANPSSKEWKDYVREIAGEKMAGRELLRGPLAVTFTFWRPRPKGHYGAKGIRPSAPPFPTTRPDCLKLARAVEDALSGQVYADDAQIIREEIAKYYGEPARVEIEVREMDEAEAFDSFGEAHLEPEIVAVTPP